MLLAFECVARTASACVMRGNDEVAYGDLAGGEAERGLVTLLNGMLNDLVNTHGKPTALAVALGPGSFTGLRIAITAARTLAWIEGLPVHGVDSLAASAAERGDGLWWVLLPLKKDTTFHGLFRVSHGIVETLQATVAAGDEQTPVLHPLTSQAVAVGPALLIKPGLAQTWCPGVQVGNASALTARGVARLAPQVPVVDWSALLPAYHQQPAPVLQRQQADLNRAGAQQ